MIDTDWGDIWEANWLWSVTVDHKTNITISVIIFRHLLKTGGYTRSISGQLFSLASAMQIQLGMLV